MLAKMRGVRLVVFLAPGDWRDVDGAPVRIGALLARDKLRSEVVLCVRAQVRPMEVAR